MGGITGTPAVGYASRQNANSGRVGDQMPQVLQEKADQSAYGQTTNANRPNADTDFANERWTRGPDGQWHQYTGLNDTLTSADRGLQQQYADMLRKPMDDGSGARDQAITAAYGQATSRLDPQWDKRMEAQRTQLLNQGLDPTSEAGKNSMAELGQQRNDAYSSAMNNAIGQGTAAGNSVFQNNLAARNNPLQQMAAMQGLTKMPAFNMAGQAPTSHDLDALYADNNIAIGQQAQANQQTADTVQGGAQAMQAIAAMAALA